jgi:hypothetical protein
MPFARAGSAVSSVLGVVGGALLATGARLPWMSFFAGLRPLRGTRGSHGQVLFACGIAVLVTGIVLAIRPDRRVRIAMGALGAACAAYASYLVVRMQMAVAHVAAHDPMMIATRGPGLYLIIAGGLIATMALGVRDRPAVAADADIASR